MHIDSDEIVASESEARLIDQKSEWLSTLKSNLKRGGHMSRESEDALTTNTVEFIDLLVKMHRGNTYDNATIDLLKESYILLNKVIKISGDELTDLLVDARNLIEDYFRKRSIKLPSLHVDQYPQTAAELVEEELVKQWPKSPLPYDPEAIKRDVKESLFKAGMSGDTKYLDMVRHKYKESNVERLSKVLDGLIAKLRQRGDEKEKREEELSRAMKSDERKQGYLYYVDQCRKAREIQSQRIQELSSALDRRLKKTQQLSVPKDKWQGLPSYAQYKLKVGETEVDRKSKSVAELLCNQLKTRYHTKVEEE